MNNKVILLIIDPQNDFHPGGSLGINGNIILYYYIVILLMILFVNYVFIYLYIYI